MELPPWADHILAAGSSFDLYSPCQDSVAACLVPLLSLSQARVVDLDLLASWETVTDVTSITMLHASLCPWQVRRVLPLVLISSTSRQLPSTAVTKCSINWACVPVPTVCNGFYTKIASFFKNCNWFWGSAVLVHVTEAFFSLCEPQLNNVLFCKVWV